MRPPDVDADGVSVVASSLVRKGGTIQATDDSTNATLTHSAMTFANHKVDTQGLLLKNLAGEPQARLPSAPPRAPSFRSI